MWAECANPTPPPTALSLGPDFGNETPPVTPVPSAATPCRPPRFAIIHDNPMQPPGNPQATPRQPEDRPSKLLTLLKLLELEPLKDVKC